MNKTLLWAEWRQKRFVFIAMVILFGGMWLLVWLSTFIFPVRETKDTYDNVIMLLMFVTLFIIPFVALYDPATWGIRKNIVNPFLFGMPVSPGEIFWTKFFIGQFIMVLFYGGNLALICLWRKVWQLDETLKTLPLAFIPIMMFPLYWIFFGMSQAAQRKDKSLGLFFTTLVYSTITTSVVLYVILGELLTLKPPRSCC